MTGEDSAEDEMLYFTTVCSAAYEDSIERQRTLALRARQGKKPTRQQLKRRLSVEGVAGAPKAGKKEMVRGKSMVMGRANVAGGRRCRTALSSGPSA